MQVTETLNDGLKRGFQLVIPAGEIARRVDGAVAEAAPQVRMPGFRPGRVPANLVRRMHGPALRQDAIRQAVEEGVQKLLGERGLRPATQPDVALDGGQRDGEDIRVDLSLEVLPEVPRPALEGIALERLEVAPDDAALDEALARVAQEQKRFVDAPEGHAAGQGDLVVMDFRGTVDGEPFEGGTGEGLEVELGSDRLIPGFEQQLLGARPGDERLVELSIPDDYPSDAIRGRDARFEVKVTALRTAEVPALDEALATNLGLESLEQLRAVLSDRLASELEAMTRTHMKRKLLDHLAGTHDFPVPPTMVEQEYEQIRRQAGEAGEAGEEGEVAEDDAAEYRRIAERRVRLGLLLSDIGTRESVTVTQGEMSRLVSQEVARYPGQEQEVAKFFQDNPMAAAQLRAPLFEDKVVDLLLARAEVTARAVTRVELEAAIESEDETPHAHGGHAHAGHVHGPDCDHGHDHAHDQEQDPESAERAGS